MKAIVFAALFCVLVSSPVYSEPENPGDRAMLAWTVLECGILAEYASEDENYHDRTELLEASALLKEEFIELARSAISEARSGQEGYEAFRKDAPVVFRLALGGPSVDFVAGRWFGMVSEDVAENVFNAPEYDRTDELRQMYAQNEYRQKNCEFLVPHSE